ncbi:YiiD C-terminal domain-containing protein [Marinicella litoralis]|uniref:Thioesterase domain-containing protein n=1 Tax=Marinicella litoralis TaxID=644220 RepID=A0A4R6XLU1_9GAMM|nr:YiiD C-terminal domain-containing protein [Marinicella litoralis]TDR20536.1 thioesterase domain-containing protein [Marinicella litoralis]
MNTQLPAFQDFLYAHIPMVKAMQMNLTSLSEQTLSATAPLSPNINDKSTVFGGSSAALMTICGWSLIKLNLECHGVMNDVVIQQAETQWLKAQSDDLTIEVQSQEPLHWQEICQQVTSDNRTKKILVQCQVLNTQNEICCTMIGSYVILKPK